jgi:hypothetical protein
VREVRFYNFAIKRLLGKFATIFISLLVGMSLAFPVGMAWAADNNKSVNVKAKVVAINPVKEKIVMPKTNVAGQRSSSLGVFSPFGFGLGLGGFNPFGFGFGFGFPFFNDEFFGGFAD